MNEKEAYLKIAERTLDSSEKLINEGLQETSGFYTYHAFESLGGALCAHFNREYPQGHDKKINQFIATSSKVDNQFKRAVSEVATILQSFGRNNFLYPDRQPNGSIQLPQDKLTKTDAQDMLRRVKGIRNRLKKIIAS